MEHCIHLFEQISIALESLKSAQIYQSIAAQESRTQQSGDLMGFINLVTAKPVHLVLAKDRVRSVKRGHPWIFPDVGRLEGDRLHACIVHGRCIWMCGTLPLATGKAPSQSVPTISSRNSLGRLDHGSTPT